MARILIREDTAVVERLLGAIVAHSGHVAVPLESRPSGQVEGDLLLVDPSAAGAAAWASWLRAEDPSLPVVCVGGDPRDGSVLALRPESVVPKPFTIGALERAISGALRDDS